MDMDRIIYLFFLNERVGDCANFIDKEVIVIY